MNVLMNIAELGQRGYTPEELIKTLESYGCRGRLLDINKKEFITTNNYGKKNMIDTLNLL
jgi:hypothetical protein